MGQVLDLDAARDERAKKRADTGWEAPVVRFAGETFVLPAELPFEFLRALEANDAEAATRELLGDDYPRFAGLRPTLDDHYELAGGVAELYSAPTPNGTAPPPKPAKARVRRRPAEETV